MLQATRGWIEPILARIAEERGLSLSSLRNHPHLSSRPAERHVGVRLHGDALERQDKRHVVVPSIDTLGAEASWHSTNRRQ